jgi:hypothetical protein
VDVISEHALITGALAGFPVANCERSSYVNQSVARSSEAGWVVDAEFNAVNGGDVVGDPGF